MKDTLGGKLGVPKMLGWGGMVAACLMGAPGQGAGPATAVVALSACRVEGVEARCGVYEVFENRRSRQGRLLPLKIVVIPAVRPHPDEGPVFYLAGGPGETATEMAAERIESGDREEHEVVLVDERGTGEGHRLDCPSDRSDEDLESYLRSPFDPAAARACRRELERRHDLSLYPLPTRRAFPDGLDAGARPLLRGQPEARAFQAPCTQPIGDLSCLRP